MNRQFKRLHSNDQHVRTTLTNCLFHVKQTFLRVPRETSIFSSSIPVRMQFKVQMFSQPPPVTIQAQICAATYNAIIIVHCNLSPELQFSSSQKIRGPTESREEACAQK